MCTWLTNYEPLHGNLTIINYSPKGKFFNKECTGMLFLTEIFEENYFLSIQQHKIKNNVSNHVKTPLKRLILTLIL